MKVPYTKIVSVFSDEGSVEIKFVPQGSDDTADRRMVIRVSPHSDYIHVSFSGPNLNKRITKVESGANVAKIHYGAN